MNIYKNKPLKTKNGVPEFSVIDHYIQNYEEISIDHTQSMNSDNPNPWISSEIWNEMESSTVELFNTYSQSFKSKKTLKVLDVGVGLGRLLEKVGSIHKNIDMYGMDIAMPYLKEAKAKGIDVCFSKIEDMPYQDDCFDIILCTDVLEHVFDLNLCVSKILSVLKRGGILIVRVPHREDLSPYLRSDYPYELAHLRNFDKSNLETLFSKIFPHNVLGFEPGLYQKRPNWLKYDLPFKLYRKCLYKSLELFSRYFPKTERRIVEKIFHPIEINVVVKKT